MQIYHPGKNKRFILYECQVIFRQLKPRFEPVFAYSGGILNSLHIKSCHHNLLYVVFLHFFDHRDSKFVFNIEMTSPSVNKVCFHVVGFSFDYVFEDGINDLLILFFGNNRRLSTILKNFEVYHKTD